MNFNIHSQVTNLSRPVLLHSHNRTIAAGCLYLQTTFTGEFPCLCCFVCAESVSFTHSFPCYCVRRDEGEFRVLANFPCDRQETLDSARELGRPIMLFSIAPLNHHIFFMSRLVVLVVSAVARDEAAELRP